MHARKELDRADCIMDGRQLGRNDKGQPIRLSYGSTGVFTHSGRTIDKYEVVAIRQERKRVLNRVSRRGAERLHGLGSIQNMQSAMMLQKETLHEFSIKSVHIVDQLVEAVLMPP